MKKFILGLLTTSIISITVIAEELPSHILSDTETHGKRHLRLMPIPSDKEATEKIKKGEMPCFEDYCFLRISNDATRCKLYNLPLLSGSLISDGVPCVEWLKEYNNSGKLHRYGSFLVDSQTISLSSKNKTTWYGATWHENGQVSSICYINNGICQYFDLTGQLIRECREIDPVKYCSDYDIQSSKWNSYSLSEWQKITDWVPINLPSKDLY